MHRQIIGYNVRLLWIPPESCGSYLRDVIVDIDDIGIVDVSDRAGVGAGRTRLITHISNIVVELPDKEAE